MLKDEASLSREKMKILDINNLLKNVIDEFNNTNAVIEKNIKKIRITIAIAKTVLIIKFFLSATAIKISFASLVTTI